jgi:cell division protein FtsZ
VRKKQLDKVPLEKHYTIEEQTKAEEQTGFEVKEKKISPKTESNISSQRTIEFDIKDYSNTNQTNNEIDQTIDARRAATRVKNIKRNYEQMRELNLNHRERQMNIDDLESQPAYLRKNIKLNDSKPSEEKKISKFSLDDDEDGGVKLSNNNRYLNEKVD